MTAKDQYWCTVLSELQRQYNSKDKLHKDESNSFARIPCFATFARTGGGGATPLGVSKRSVVELRRKDQQIALAEHGSSEDHEMLKRNDKYHSIADDVPIPKM